MKDGKARRYVFEDLEIIPNSLSQLHISIINFIVKAKIWLDDALQYDLFFIIAGLECPC